LNSSYEDVEAYLGHSVTLDSLARETDLEDLVHLRSKRSSTGRDVFDVSTEQISDLIVSDPLDWCGDRCTFLKTKAS
jgi:hypothetical protein